MHRATFGRSFKAPPRLPRRHSIPLKRLLRVPTALCVALSMLHASPLSADDRLTTFDEIAATVSDQFFDPSMNGTDWADHVATYRDRVVPDMDVELFAETINEMLAVLEASHTRLYVRDSPLWYQLAGLFLPGYAALADDLGPYLTDGAPIYAGIGVSVETRPEGDFVVGVLDGHPADEAGVVLGDRIVSVDGRSFDPIRSFEGRAGQTNTLHIERRPSVLMSLEVTPVLLDGGTMFETAMRESTRVFDIRGSSVGYIHAWSYAGQRYHDILVESLLYGQLRDAEALVLDLRGGWGGANSTYLNLFAAQSVQLSSTGRDGEERAFASAWDRPVVLLVDEGTRSGKEVFAHGFRTLGLGPIVGETTAGAVLAGRINALTDGSLLYVAVAETRVDGVRLEGQGVRPDHVVPFDPPFAAGYDPQLDRAIALAAELAEEARTD